MCIVKRRNKNPEKKEEEKLLKLMGNVQLGTLLLLLFLVKTTVSYPHHPQDVSHITPDNPHIKYTYNRLPEIEKHCGSLISSASELPPDDNRGERMKKELSFIYGDWVQESKGAPLMPFDSKERSSHSFDYYPPLKLVSFWLMDVDPIRRAKNTLSVSAAMDIGLFTSDIFAYKPYHWHPEFQKGPGHTKLTILFEGIYVESGENGGRGLMCLLGNATIPDPNSSPQQGSCQNGNPMCLLEVNKQPFGLQDDQIMLVLKYPKTLTLTSRGISGEMHSLNQKWSLTYFDRIQISSLLGHKFLKYQFGSHELLLSNTCSPEPWVHENIDLYKEDGYCDKLKKFVSWGVFEGNEKGKIGPFSLREIEAVYNSSDKLRFVFQDLECEPVTDHNGENSALVSAVLRVIQKSDYVSREGVRTGLSTMTLSAEGKWHSSDGQLCMVGCHGPPDGLSERCSSRITLYIPLTFSMKQRSMAFGILSSIVDDGSQSYPPLVFQRLATPQEYMNAQQCGGHIDWSYSYSKLAQAKEFQRRSNPSKIGISLRKSLFQYPAASYGSYDNASLSSLADELSVKAFAAQIQVEIVVLSIGSLVGRYGPRSYEEKIELDKRITSSSSRCYEEIEVSGHLSISGGKFYDESISFEGLYDPAVGMMYLIGCNDERNLERELDCLIEIKVEYSPRNAEWLLNPKIKFLLKSRSKSVNTLLVSHKMKFDEATILIRRGLEDGLRILSLITVILCIRGQIRYTKTQGRRSHTAYISLVMLGMLTMSFIIPLITGAKVFLKWKEFAEQTNDIYDFRMSRGIFQSTIDYTIKILLLLAFLESKELLKKVVKSRKLEKNQRIPSDKLVFLLFLLIHVLGFSIFHALRKSLKIPLHFESEKYELSSLGKGRLGKWRIELENYSGIVQDLFLLPQIIGNALWGVQIQGKPLRKLYYFGFTSIRLVLMAYDCVRDPLPYHTPPDSGLETQYLRIEPYLKLANIAISAMVVTLALTLHIQQKYGSRKMESLYERLHFIDE